MKSTKKRLVGIALILALILSVIPSCPEQLPALAAETETAAVAAPVFSHESGNYKNAFELTLSAEEGTTIYYSTDGSNPVPEKLRNEAESADTALVFKYNHDEKISIHDRTGEENVLATETNSLKFAQLKSFSASKDNVAKSTVIRAMAVDADGNRSPIVTKTYFVGTNLTTRYSGLPVFSMVTDPANLMDDDIGIFVTGNHENYSQHGRDWEREAYIDFYNDNGEVDFSSNIGIRVHGGYTRQYPQKSLNVYFREEYGQKNLKYELIPGATNHEGTSKTKKYKGFMLRNGGNSSANQFETAWVDMRPRVEDILIKHCAVTAPSTVSFSTNLEQAAGLTINSLTEYVDSANTWSGTYYKEIPLHIVAPVVEGYKFKNWKITGGTTAEETLADTSVHIEDTDVSIQAVYEVDDSPVTPPPATQEPSESPAPSVTELPVQTSEPTETTAPPATGTPVTTAKPFDTSTPQTTKTPTATTKPSDTPAPPATGTPAGTAKPSDTAVPQTTGTPAVTTTPANTADTPAIVAPDVPQTADIKAPGKAVIQKVRSKKKRTATITIKKLKADGFEVVYAKNKKFTKGRKKKRSVKRTFKLKKLKSGTIWYVKVRAFRKTANGTYLYGKFSKKRRIKIK